MKKLLIILAFLIGCASSQQSTHGGLVEVYQPRTIGTGVVVGENIVMTVGHVVDEGWVRLKLSNNPLTKYTKFYRLATIERARDSIVILYGDYEFKPSAVFKLGCKKSPSLVRTRRGLFEVDNYLSQPGDSGSAVVCEDGHLLGLVYGHKVIKIKSGDKIIKMTGAPVFVLFKE